MDGRSDHPGLCVIYKLPTCLIVGEGAKQSTLAVSQFEHMWPPQGHRPACDNRIITHHTEEGQIGGGQARSSDLLIHLT